MAYERIRIFAGEESTIVGFSMGASRTLEREPAKVEFDALLAQGEQTITKIDTPLHLAHIWSEYFEIQPPLSNEQLEKFGKICVKYSRHPEGCQVSDNREEIPSRAFETVGRVVAQV